MKFVLVLPFLLSALSFAEPAFRFENETYEAAVERNGSRLDGLSAHSVAEPLSQLKLSQITTWKHSDINLVFEKVRDERFLTPAKQPQFPRRSSWLFPQDGCYARSALASQRIEKWGYPRPQQLFAFGSLKVLTPNDKKGFVSWWYHVVPVMKDGWGTVWILDPAIDSKGPLSLTDWVQAMGNPTDLKLSICHPKTYQPHSSCTEPSQNEDSSATSSQLNFLDSEWNNLLSLKRDPTEELGNSPPWSPGH